MTEKDPWAGAGDATRAEVREIFSRHATSGAAEGEAGGVADRRTAVPGVMSLPLHGWRMLGPRGRVAALLVLSGMVIAVAASLPPALETGERAKAEERRAAEATRARIRRRLVEDQRPRRARLDVGAPAAPGLEREVLADARRRIAAGTLEGPVRGASCERISRTGEDPAYASFTCLVERGERGVYLDREVLIGYRFRARVELATGLAAWCKENPRPLHPDQEEFITVPVARACVG